MDEVNKLTQQLQQQEQAMIETKQKLKVAIERLQNACIHDFYREDDGDYHRPTYYYVCRICQYVTTHPLKNK